LSSLSLVSSPSEGMQLLNLSTRTLKEEEEDDSPSVISSHHKVPPSIPAPPIHSHLSVSSSLWFILSVYAWAWIRLLYAVYAREIEDVHCKWRVCLDDAMICLVSLAGLSLLMALIGLLRWSPSLLYPFLLTQAVSSGGVAGAIVYQSYSEFSKGNRLVHVYAFCLLSMTVLCACVVGVLVTLRGMDHMRRAPVEKRKGRIELFANPLFSPDSVNAPREVRYMPEESTLLSEWKTPPALIALFEETDEVGDCPMRVISPFLHLTSSSL
ncbi:hypothetical protein PMAYCL1PPCAC_24074, partial [Pristionchus mayeri]